VDAGVGHRGCGISLDFDRHPRQKAGASIRGSRFSILTVSACGARTAQGAAYDMKLFPTPLRKFGQLSPISLLHVRKQAS